MIKDPYTPGAYSPNLFNQLPPFEEAERSVRSKVQNHQFSEIRNLFHQYNVQTKYGLTMLHRHFKVANNERVVEFRGVATPWPVTDSDNIFGGKIVPRCWAFFDDNELHPTEFSFQLPGDASVDEPTFEKAFVDALYAVLSKWGLERSLGLTAFESAEKYLKVREVERTVGRVSITIPMAAEESASWLGSNSAETAWTFGCAESMDDSQLLQARICWVCYSCVPKPKE